MSELNLTAARNSLWCALDHWPETRGVFTETYRCNEASSLFDNQGPSISDFPAIGILPASVTPVWFTHEMQQFPLVYDVRIWTQDWALPESEELVEKVLNAFYRAKPPGQSVTYVKQATGFYPERLGPITWTPAQVGADKSVKAILCQMSIGLKLQKDPFSN